MPFHCLFISLLLTLQFRVTSANSLKLLEDLQPRGLHAIHPIRRIFFSIFYTDVLQGKVSLISFSVSSPYDLLLSNLQLYFILALNIHIQPFPCPRRIQVISEVSFTPGKHVFSLFWLFYRLPIHLISTSTSFPRSHQLL